ncbi:putative F-box protein At2g02030 [Papaver somniferum]|uniref:putative F-box protein At2g02030 n=1 Tax=Papaver somniferum TaxID=3469 RepID=UPI000E703ACA|nr:putative F-box protein At2g02030 [Papaver somniferum]
MALARIKGKRNFKKFIHINSMEKLPLEITENILSRLPIALRLQCREVCGTWRTLMPKPKMGLLYKVSARNKAGEFEARFYFSKHSSDKVSAKHVDDDDYFETLTKLDHGLIIPPSAFKSFMVGSCNGLACYAYNQIFHFDYDETKVYVCNPVTGEQHIQLPITIKWDISTYGRRKNTIGFGYIRSSYKVVSICVDSSQPANVQVYTLGGGGTGWRNKMGVFAGGALYWMDQSNGLQPKRILAFDLEQERFELHPSIPFLLCDSSCVRIMELRGNLCLLEVVPSKHVVIWESTYRKTVKCTQKQHRVDDSDWLKKFSIAWEDYGCMFEPFALSNSEKGLLWYNVIVSCYDSETNTLRKADEILKKLKDDFYKVVFTTTQATPHVNSLVSCS